MWKSEAYRNQIAVLALVASDAAYKAAESFSGNDLLRSFPDNDWEDEYQFPEELLPQSTRMGDSASDSNSPLFHEIVTTRNQRGFGVSTVEFKNWTFVDKIEADTGFGLIIYERTVLDGSASKNEYIVAVQGTDGRNAEDWYANIQLAKNQWRDIFDTLFAEDGRISGLQNPDGSIPLIHFTGQSLGGGLGQYAAYEYVRRRKLAAADGGRPFDASQLVTLTTFNGFAGGLGLSQLYNNADGFPAFVPTLLAGVPTAHYTIENEVVHRIGARFDEQGLNVQVGFLNESDAERSNLYHFKDWRHWEAATPDGVPVEQAGDQGYLGLVEGHRIESSFYQGLDRYAEDFSAAKRGGDASGHVNIQGIQAVAEIFARFLGGNQSGTFASWARVTAGTAMGAIFGTVGDVARLLQLLGGSLYRSGDINGLVRAVIASDIGSYFSALAIKLLAKPAISIAGASSLLAAIADLFQRGDEADKARQLVNLNISSSKQFRAVSIDGINDGTEVGAKDSARRFSMLLPFLTPDAVMGTALEPHKSTLDSIADDPVGFTNTLYDLDNGYKNALSMLTNAAQEGPFANEDDQAVRFGSALVLFSIDEAKRIGGDNAEVVLALNSQVGDFVVDLTSAIAAAFGRLNQEGSSIALAPIPDYSDRRAIADQVMADLGNLDFAALFGLSEENDPVLAAKIAGAKYHLETARVALAVQNVAAGANAFDAADFDPESVISGITLAEGRAVTLKTDLSYPAPKGGMRVRFQIAGASVDSIAIVNGADTVQLDGSGIFEMVVPEGQRQLTFVLWQNRNISAGGSLTLSATLLDNTGAPVHQTSTEATLAVLAADEGSDTLVTSNTILGDVDGDGLPQPGRNDLLVGTAANDLIDGLAGDDQLAGNAGDDWVLGGEGNDFLAGAIGDVESGNDRYEGGPGRDSVLAGGGNDLVIGGDDDLQPGVAGDYFLGGDAGNDRVYAGTQQDDATVFDSDATPAAGETEWLDGGDGDDRLIASTAADVLLGGAGADVIAGGAGADTLFGDRDSVLTPNGGQLESGFTVSLGTINAAGAADLLHGGGGDDFLYGEVGADTLLGAGGNDELHGDAVGLAEALHGGDFLDGGAGDDRLFGQGGNDALFGGAGNDMLQGDDLGHAPGDDYLSGEDGDDTLIGAGGKDVLYGGAGTDDLHGDADNIPVAQHAADELYGGEGDDTLSGYGGDDLLDGGAGADVLLGGVGKDWLLGGAGSDTLVGDEGSSNADGGDADILDGGAGNDQIFGQGGGDTLIGGEGDDLLQAGQGNDQLAGGAGADTLFGEDGDDRLEGGEGIDQLSGGDGIDIVEGGAGDDFLLGEAGADILRGGSGNDRLQAGEGNDRGEGGDGDDLIFGEAGEDLLLGDAGADELQGNDGDDRLEGGDGDDTLFGQAGSDILVGDVGDDYLDGGAGSDQLAGGEGFDVYFWALGSGSDHIIDDGRNALAFGPGILPGGFTLRMGSLMLDFGNGDAIHIEGFDPDDPFGTSSIAEFRFDDGTVLTLDEVLAQGFDLDGTPDADALEGTGLGDHINAYESDDTVASKAGNDVIDAGAGNDLVNAGEGDDVVFGGEGNDVLLGEAGNDSLDGGTGADEMAGGSGDDGYVVDDALDVVTESADQGEDFVEASVSYTMPENVEELVLTGAEDLIGTGNASDNDISGNDGHNSLYGLQGDDELFGGHGDDLLDGGEGADEMFGGTGNDTYVVDDEGDFVEEQIDFYERVIFEDPDTGETLYGRLETSGGVDAIVSSVSFELDQWTENLTLTGNDAIDGVGNVEVNVIEGNQADNALYAYRLNGESDTYPSLGVIVQQFTSPRNSAEEMLHDSANAAIYRGRFPWFVPQQVDLFAGEGDTLIGAGGDDRLYGHLDNDWLEGGEGNDLLYGFAGADTMLGGAGDDTYVVSGAYDLRVEYLGGEHVSYFDDSADTLIEEDGEGIDTVYSEVDFELPDNFENLTLVFDTTAFDPDGAISIRFGGSFASQGFGNALDNELRTLSVSSELYGRGGRDRLFGGAGDDYLEGGTDADIMAGGAGDDAYDVDEAGDQVVELAGHGIDLVYASITHMLAANVEHLILEGETGLEPLDGTGNELDNFIDGNEGENAIGGLAGNDFLRGWGGDDSLHGGAGNDILDGGLGGDFMSGGDGDDQYWVDDELDATSEDSAEGGQDVVLSSITHTLGENIEDLALIGWDAIDGIGNELANRITGNDAGNCLSGLEGNDSLFGGYGRDFLEGGNGDDRLDGGENLDELYGDEGNDYLDGGGSGDYLEGGLGDDTYVVDQFDDETVEFFDEGHDLVIATTDHSLAENIEDLRLLGDYAEHFFDVNSLGGEGNELDNVIVGNDGFNFLGGHDGDDRIDGRAGFDFIGGDNGADVLYGGDDAIFRSLGGDFGDGDEDDEDGGIVEGPPVKLPDGGEGAFEALASNSDFIEGGDGGDSIDGGSGNDHLFGEQGDDFLFGGSDGLSIDADNGFVDGGESNEANGRLFLQNNDNLQGGDGDDVLDGGSGDDQLYGGAGTDTLRGGDDGPLNTSNNDFLDGGEGYDTMAGGTGDDFYILDGTFVETTDIPVYGDCGTLIEGAVTRVWTTDTVTEHAGEGHDAVTAAAEITLPDHFEDLYLAYVADVVIGRGNDGDNGIFGNHLGNRLEGAAGNDALYGDSGDDVLDGGAGDDILLGQAGNDTYNLGPGTGHDVVVNDGGGFDVVHVTQQVTLDQVTLSTNGSDVTIGLNGSRDRLVLAGWFGSSTPVQQVVFCDGTVLDAAAIAALAQQNILVAEDDSAEVFEDGPAAAGNVLENDFDSNDSGVLTVADPGTYAGQFGTLTIAGDGSFSYALGDVQWLAEGETATDLFEYMVQDEINANDTASLEVLITGRNDAPIFGAAAAGEVTEDAVEVLFAGNFLDNGDFEDFDFFDRFPGWDVVGNRGYAGITDVSRDGGRAGYFGAIGSETFLSQDIETFADESYIVSFWLKGGGAGGVSFTATWNGTVLTALEDVTLGEYTEFRYEVAGADGASRLEFALRNDPDFWYLDEIFAGTVEEYIPAFHTAEGSLDFSDIDLSDTHFVTVEALGDGYHGFLDAQVDRDSTDTGFGSIDWHFEVANDDIDFLAEGQALTQQYAVTVEDSHGATATQIVSITLHGANDEPFAADDEAYVLEDLVREASGNALDNDDDPDAGTVLAVANPGTYLGEFGTLLIAADGSYTYTLDNDAVQFLPEGEFLEETFEYEITDGTTLNPLSGYALLQVFIDGTNDAPVTGEDLASVQEDALLVASGNVLGNDSDADDGAQLAIEAPGELAGAYGTITIEEDGSFTYALDNAAVQSLGAGQSATDSFIYLASDGIESTEGLLELTIAGTNDAPVAFDDAVSIQEDAAPVAGNVLANDADIDAGTTLSAFTPGQLTGAYGTLTLAADGSYMYALDNASSGVQALREGETVADVFTYAATDGLLISPADLVITVEGVNDAPVAVADSASVQEDSVLTASGNVLANDSDADAEAELSVTAGTFAGTYGTLALAADGSYQYELDNAAVQLLGAGEAFFDRFTYEASDGLATASGILSIAIGGVNDAPVTVDDTAMVKEDIATIASGNVLDNDSDLDRQTVLTVANAGTYGSLELNADGSYVYTLDDASAAVQSLAAGQTVEDGFGYEASDGIATTPGSLIVTIAGTNDAPVPVNPIADQSADAGTPFTFTVAANAFTDIDRGDVLSYSGTLVDGGALPSWLSFDAATRTFTGTPPGGGDDCGCEGGGAEALQVRVTAADTSGATAFDDFALNIMGGGGGGGQTVIGTDGNDILVGTPCDDVIDGRKGFDVMLGGDGNDVYYVDQTCEPEQGGHHGNEGVGNGEDPPPPGHDHNQNDGPGTSPGHPGSKGGHHHDHGHREEGKGEDCKVDLVIESAGQGYDVVYATADYTLPDHVEELRLLGGADLDGTGNGGNNVLVGNTGDNLLKGGTGSDVYVHELYGGADVIVEAGGVADTLLLGAGITAQMVSLRRRQGDLVVDLSGPHGSVTVKDWFASSRRVERIEFADGTVWDEQDIRERTHTTASHGDDCAPRRHDEREDRHWRTHDGDDRPDKRHRDDDHRRDAVADAIAGHLARGPRFDFEALADLPGQHGRSGGATPDEISRRWDAIAAYAKSVAGDEGARDSGWLDGAHTRPLARLLASAGARWGFEGSTGAERAHDELKPLEGLQEGFRRL